MNESFLSSWLVLCLAIILTTIAISIIVFLLVRRFVHVDILRRHHELAGFVIGVLGVLYSVFLGFTIVNSQASYEKIISQVNKEAYLSADLFRITEAFPEKIRLEMRNGINAYLRSVILDEWPLMYKRKESAFTLVKLEELWKPFYDFQPANDKDEVFFAQAIQILFQFNSARLQRIYSSWSSLGPLSWTALISGGLVLLTFLFFFGTENRLAQLLINTLFIGYLVFMVFVVYALDNPFRKPQMIEPKAYEVVYNYYNNTKGSYVSPEEIDSSESIYGSSFEKKARISIEDPKKDNF